MQFQGRFERSGFCYNFNSRLRVRCVAFVNEISILTTKAFTAGIPIGARRERRNPKHSAAAISQSNGMEVRRREVATIFTDITSFTSLVETATPEVLGSLLNEYVGGMTDVVFAHEGTVAKIIGDAIQILFNAPGDQPDYATRAIACAHDLDAWAEAFRERWTAKGVNFGITRIGVHAGCAGG
jgi:class 3 adenylate cyclase